MLVACGFSHSVCLAKDVPYIWGFLPLPDKKKVAVFAPFPLNVSKKIASLHCGDSLTLLLHEDGTQTIFGVPDSMTHLLEKFEAKELSSDPLYVSIRGYELYGRHLINAVQVACGGSHILLLNSSGQIYSWGLGASGALGHGNVDDCNYPKLISALKSKSVISIAAGAKHSLCCTEYGELFSWGYGANSRLGLNKQDGDWEPARVNIQIHAKIVACGESHSAFISNQGHLYTWGAGGSGRLGIGFETVEVRIPTRVDSLCNTNEKVLLVSLGVQHSACITESRKLFVWGSGSAGKLGIRDSNGEMLTSNVLLPTECFPDIVGFKQVSCGSIQTLILYEELNENQTGAVRQLLLTLGSEQHPSTAAGERFSSNPRKFQDFTLSISNKGLPKKRSKRDSTLSSSLRVSTLEKLTDDDIPRIRENDRIQAQQLLDTYISTGSIDFHDANYSLDSVKSLLSITQKILRSKSWKGVDGLSEISLNESQKKLGELRKNFQQSWERLFTLTNELREDQAFKRDEIAILIMKTNRDRPQRDHNKGKNLLLDLEALNSGFSFRGGEEAETNEDRIMHGRGKWRASSHNIRERRFTEKLKSLESIFSEMFFQPDTMFQFWKDIHLQEHEDILSNQASKNSELFYDLCGDLYQIKDIRSERIFKTLLVKIIPWFLEDLVFRRVKINSPLFYRDGPFPNLLKRVYLNCVDVRRFFFSELTDFITLLVHIEIDLDLDPYAVTLKLENKKRENLPKNTVVYIKQAEDFPNHPDEQYAKKCEIFLKNPVVRKDIIPKIEILTRLLEEFGRIFLRLTRSEAKEVRILKEYFRFYSRRMSLSFGVKETDEVCVLTILRTYFYFVIVPILENFQQINMLFNVELTKISKFNLAEFVSIADKCFGNSNYFDPPWLNALLPAVKKLKNALLKGTPFISEDKTQIEEDEMEQITQIFTMDTLEIHPTLRSGEFVKQEWSKRISKYQDIPDSMKLSPTGSIRSFRYSFSEVLGSLRSTRNTVGDENIEKQIDYSSFSDKLRFPILLDIRKLKIVGRIESHFANIDLPAQLSFALSEATEKLLIWDITDPRIFELELFKGHNLENLESITEKDRNRRLRNITDSLKLILDAHIERLKTRENLNREIRLVEKLNRDVEDAIAWREIRKAYINEKYTAILRGDKQEPNRELLNEMYPEVEAEPPISLKTPVIITKQKRVVCGCFPSYRYDSSFKTIE